jgi:hypothetical protein
MMKRTKSHQTRGGTFNKLPRLVRDWTAEESEELIRLYEDGGDKACLPMRIIAKRLGRSEAACWARLIRVCRAARAEADRNAAIKKTCGDKIGGEIIARIDTAIANFESANTPGQIRPGKEQE